jgi:arylsulfatase A
LRGLKRDIYEGGHRVPTIIRWPGLTKAGSITDALFSQTDLIATLAACLGFELPRTSAEDSYNFYPWLKGEAASPPRVAMVHNTAKGQYAIRNGDWVLVNAESGTTRQPPPEFKKKHKISDYGNERVGLYQLKQDIGQRNNLAKAHPDKVAELQALLQKLRDQGHSAPRLAAKEADAPTGAPKAN